MVRFAPSPIRDMYISDLRLAILNYIFAKQRDEKFLVRIEDTQKDKNIEGMDSEIMLILEKFGIVHDFVYHQSQHRNIHQNLALKLLEEDKAFKDINSLTLKVKPQDDIYIKDLLKGKLNYPLEDIEPFEILEKELPTKIFASACGDILNKISLVIREEEDLKDSVREFYIQNLLYYRDIEYLHVPPIVDNKTVKWLLEEGFIPDAIINYIIVESYISPPNEIFYLKDAISWFDYRNISIEPIEFNIDKLRFLNKEHIKLIDDKSLSRVFGFADVNIGKLAKLYLDDCSTLNELNSKIMPIFKPKNFENSWGKEMIVLSNIIFNSPAFEKFDEFETYLMEKSNLKGDKLYTPLRLLLTNSKDGPELSKIYPLIKSYILEVAS